MTSAFPCPDCGWDGHDSHIDHAAHRAYVLGLVVRYGDDNDADYLEYKNADHHAGQVKDQ
jgi:hypothetical protein